MTRPAAPAVAPSLGARLAATSREDAVRERFVRAVLAEVPLERVAELHLFAPMRQGSDESGVAVVAALPVVPVEQAADAVAHDAVAHDAVAHDAPKAATRDVAASTPARHTIYTARYRLAVKGPDRGRWQFDLREEADAPLVTVDAVVRGVQRRVDDAREPERLSPAECARVAGVTTEVVAPGER